MDTPKAQEPQPMINHRICQYSIVRKFLPNSGLHSFLSTYYPQTFQLAKKDYTLFTVIKSLRKIIQEKRLFDPRNPACVIASPELERALDMKYLHCTEVSFLTFYKFILKNDVFFQWKLDYLKLHCP